MSNKPNKKQERPQFPKRAVVTAGMPYGNKELHFGHIGGVFVHADVYARFLRDRLGEENVVFVSGTDCYGSPIAEGYRVAKKRMVLQAVSKITSVKIMTDRKKHWIYMKSV